MRKYIESSYIHQAQKLRIRPFRVFSDPEPADRHAAIPRNRTDVRLRTREPKPEVDRSENCRAAQTSPRKFSCSFFRRKSQRRPRGENRREAAAHLAERSQKTALFCTIVPGARCATASSPDIFTSRNYAGLRPAIEIQCNVSSPHRNPSSSQAKGLHDRTAKNAEKVAATARAPGAGVQKAKSFVPAQRATATAPATFRRA